MPSPTLQAAFGVPSIEGVDCSRLRICDAPHFHKLVDAVRSQRPHLLQTTRVLAPKDALEPRFLACLIEDRAQASMSYVEFLCHVHRQIQNKFNN